VRTYEEWRVTGTWRSGDPYDYVWTHDKGGSESEVRAQVAYLRTLLFTDGPHLHKRTVTRTDWEEIEP
jgi:hypothetical protein